MLIENKCVWPNLCNRIVFISKAAGGVRPIGLLFAIVRTQCKLRRIEAKMWEATQARGVERCVWEQAAWSEWATADGHAVATILRDLLKAFDHVAYRKLIDAAGRTRFPMRQLKLLLPLYQAARHVELDGVAGEALQAQRGIIPGCAFATTLLQLLLERRIGLCPFVSWSTTFRCSSLATTTALRQARASRVRDSHQEVQGSQQLNHRAGKAAGTAAAAWRAGDADRTKPWNRLRAREASDHRGATGAA